MSTIKKISGFGAALLMTAVIGSAYAEEGELTQTREQDRVRSETNLQTPNSEPGQARNREEKMLMNKNQNQYQNQYRYSNQYRSGNNETGENSMKQNMKSNSRQGSNESGSMNRQNMSNRSGSMAGSGGGRR